MSTPSIDNRNQENPAEGVDVCPGCGGSETATLLDHAVDYEYGIQGDFRFAQCSCGLVFLSPRPTLHAIRSFYPAEYHAYQRPTSCLFRLLHRAQFRPRIRRYRRYLPEHGRVLDVGCGDGSLLREIGRQGPWELFGLDFNPEAFASAEDGGAPIHYFAGPIEDASYQRNSFDLIVMHHLLEHVPQPRATVARVFELLRPGGWLVGQLPNYDSIERRFTGRWWNGFHTPRHMQCFSPKTLTGLLKRAGFDSMGTRAALHPGQWALSLQSYVADRWLRGTRLRHGKAWFYPACLVTAIPLVVMEVMLHEGGIIDFEARKPLVAP